LLYEQAASAYLDLLDEKGRHPTINALWKRLSERHPDYPEDETRDLLKSAEFDQTLQDRRKRHQIERAAVALTAAERAGRLSPQLFDLMEEKLRVAPEDIRFKELVDAAKMCVELDSKVTRVVAETTGSGDLTINLKFQNLLMGLPAERRAAVIGEVMRAGGSPVLELVEGETDGN